MCSYFNISEQTYSSIELEINELLKDVKFNSKETQDIEFTFINLFYTSLQMKIDQINDMETAV